MWIPCEGYLKEYLMSLELLITKTKVFAASSA